MCILKVEAQDAIDAALSAAAFADELRTAYRVFGLDLLERHAERYARECQTARDEVFRRLVRLRLVTIGGVRHCELCGARYNCLDSAYEARLAA